MEIQNSKDNSADFSLTDLLINFNIADIYNDSIDISTMKYKPVQDTSKPKILNTEFENFTHHEPKQSKHTSSSTAQNLPNNNPIIEQINQPMNQIVNNPPIYQPSVNLTYQSAPFTYPNMNFTPYGFPQNWVYLQQPIYQVPQGIGFCNNYQEKDFLINSLTEFIRNNPNFLEVINTKEGFTYLYNLITEFVKIKDYLCIEYIYNILIQNFIKFLSYSYSSKIFVLMLKFLSSNHLKMIWKMVFLNKILLLNNKYIQSSIKYLISFSKETTTESFLSSKITSEYDEIIGSLQGLNLVKKIITEFSPAFTQNILTFISSNPYVYSKTDNSNNLICFIIIEKNSTISYSTKLNFITSIVSAFPKLTFKSLGSYIIITLLEYWGLNICKEIILFFENNFHEMISGINSSQVLMKINEIYISNGNYNKSYKHIRIF